MTKPRNDTSGPTSVDQWREGALFIETLPSGKKIQLKRVGILDLVVAGRIPDHLTAITERSISEETMDKLTLKETKDYTELVNLIVICSAVNPKIVDDTPRDDNGSTPRVPEDCLGVSELAFVDKIFIFNWANGVLQPVSRFRNRRPLGAS